MVRLFLLFCLLTGCTTGTSDSSSQNPSRDASPQVGFALLGFHSSNIGSILPQFLSLNIKKTMLLWRSFGNDYSHFYTWLRTEGKKWVKIDPFNGPGRRNERLGPSDFLPHLSVDELNHALEFETHNGAIRAWLLDVLLFVDAASEVSDTTFLLSLGLETDYTPLAAMNLLKLITEVWPYEVVYNPLNPDDCNYMPEWVYCETHGIFPKIPRYPRCLISNDGIDFESTEEAEIFMEYGKQHGCTVLLWSGETQGISEQFVPTLEREFSFNDVGFFQDLLNPDS